ncbi:hypothetical protein TPSD3_11230 [Thioflexithrix psekupsensis]|uniref:DUF4154 domain-containing protein n=1 Tax=Thioflexithrix psekupsensis TaxID=1570016 RepID=A0A251X7P2_9GAMM|nr:hypothetical protein TPSD3_11230 [Thioflexithrix psekupsensis]
MSQVSDDYFLKSTFLLNLVRFIEWPDEPMPKPEPLYFCFFGNDSFGTALDNIREKTVRGRELIIRKNIAFFEIKTCHLLFIDASKKEELNSILEATANYPILTVGDTPDFASAGGLVNLINYQGRIMLEINIDAAQRTQLRISSRLLSLARLIEEKRSQ